MASAALSWMLVRGKWRYATRTSSGLSLSSCANTGAMTAQPGHWKSPYSMIVTLASSGPCAQSVALTGGISDCSVGPGVGSRLTAVQLASDGSTDWSSAGVGETSGRGGSSGLGVTPSSWPGCTCSSGGEVGLAGVLWQAARNNNNNTERVIIFFTIHFSFHNQGFNPPNFTNETDK